MLRFGFTASLFTIAAIIGASACSSSNDPSPSSSPSSKTDSTDPPPAPPPHDAGAAVANARGETCNATKACSGDSKCVTSGGDEGFCALACDPKVGCAHGLRCADVGGRGSFCLDTCADDGDCAKGFVCTRSVGAALGKYACVRSCNEAADYCGDGVTCGSNGLCPPKFTCDLDSSGVDPEKTFGALTSTERGAVCDFSVCPFGGYGKSTKCDGGLSVSSPESKSDCIAKTPFTKCASLTVGEYEACEKKMRADECNSFAVLANDPDCAPVKACAM